MKTYNKNLLTGFKKPTRLRKNFRAAIALVSSLLPGTGEVNYIVCKK